MYKHINNQISFILTNKKKSEVKIKTQTMNNPSSDPPQNVLALEEHQSFEVGSKKEVEGVKAADNLEEESTINESLILSKNPWRNLDKTIGKSSLNLQFI